MLSWTSHEDQIIYLNIHYSFRTVTSAVSKRFCQELDNCITQFEAISYRRLFPGSSPDRGSTHPPDKYNIEFSISDPDLQSARIRIINVLPDPHLD